MTERNHKLMEKLVALCRRRGFIFQSSEIYGGINGFWDYGPLGVELKRNIKDAWWEDNVERRDDIVGLDCSIIMNPRVWEASGHVDGFNDPMVDCRESKGRYRADQLQVIHSYDVDEGMESESKAELLFAFLDNDEDSRQRALRKAKNQIKKSGGGTFNANAPSLAFLAPELKGREEQVVGPDAKSPGTLTEPRQFNLMFQTYIGATQSNESIAYLRPETAQGIFANFQNVLDSTRLKVPFGIAQIGKSFRNEVNPRNYTFRSREFEQMEIEFFCHPNDSEEWYAYWRDERYQWYVNHGLRSSRLQLRDHDGDELAHYANGCADVEYEFPFGISELEGVANRTDYDLKKHGKHSGKEMEYFDDQSRERFVPHVIEPSGGVDRATLAFLCEAYTEDEVPDEKGNLQPRVIMKFHPRLAPVKVAIFPLIKKEGMPEVANQLHEACRNAGISSFYDEKGAIGRRYRRQDEAGTPFCVTVDGQTMSEQSVTIRDRDTLAQDRISTERVVDYVRERIEKV